LNKGKEKRKTEWKGFYWCGKKAGSSLGILYTAREISIGEDVEGEDAEEDEVNVEDEVTVEDVKMILNSRKPACSS
jgi:hypothetical protein